MATVVVHHTVTTGAPADTSALVDGPAWDAAHTVTGLENVDNTSDANKPVSTATQTALNLKANSASPSFTGTSSFSGTVLFGGIDGTQPIGGVNTTNFQIHGINGPVGQSMDRWQNSNVPARVIFSKSRGTTQNTFTIVPASEVLGILQFAGADGVAFREAANIQVQTDGTPSAGSMPGKWIFSTSPTGSVTPVQRVSIFQDGGVLVGPGTSSPGAGVFSVTNQIQFGSFTVSTLPTGAAGQTVFCSNCRVFNGAGTQEGAGVGTGGLVSYNGTAWKIVGTNITAVA